jgi:hypothetical protein
MPEPIRRYEAITEVSRETVERALREDDVEVLRRAVVAVALHDADWRYAQTLCISLSTHPHYNVRGNAILGFGHIARIHGKLDQSIVQPIIEAALWDPNDYVRGHGVDAADDTKHFLKWHYDETNPT